MSSDHQTVLTESGLVSVIWLAPDTVRVAMDNARPPGGQSRYRVRGNLFMPEPGQFIDIDPDGEEILSMEPQEPPASVDDIAVIAADLAAGVPLNEGCAITEGVRADREALRLAVTDAVMWVLDLVADQAERAAMEALAEPDEGGPAYRM